MDLVGKLAPDFKAPDQNDKTHQLSDYVGQKVLLYFYPKDDTPGCTTEACNFRDHLNELKGHDVQVLGVSVDDVDSHQKFAKKYDLNFPLLADLNKKIVQYYGVWKEKNMMGKKFMGIQRDSFLIDEKGTVVKHYKRVKPKEHVDQVLQDLESM